MLAQHRLDLPQLDAEPPHLHLAIEPPQVVDRAVRPEAGEVSRAVEPRSRLAAPGVRCEPIGGDAGLSQVAAGGRDACDAELAPDSRLSRLQIPTEHVEPGV